MRKLGVFWLLLLFAACQEVKETSVVSINDFYQSQLFKEVQLTNVFPDGKTFVDCSPNKPYGEIIASYEEEKVKEGFNLSEFVKANFDMPYQPKTDFVSDTSKSMVSHINSLWPVLTRQPDEVVEGNSLIPLSKSYIVPGGRFREIYYWDSYFTIEGLMDAGQDSMAANMLDNFSHLIDSIGFIPNGNRAYYNGRSQPPFYSVILAKLYSENRDKYLSYLPQLVKEYEFWMNGEENMQNGSAYSRVVKLEDGTIFNRYYDNNDGPRPESYKEDHELVHENGLEAEVTYKHLRAGAESGWDFSSRWFADGKNIKTIQTTNIIPVDLNSLMYHLELKIAQGYNWNEQLDSADYYLERAANRKEAINKYLWDEEIGFFVDYNFIDKKATGVLSLAAAYPLFFSIASKKQAKRTSQRLTEDFLKEGGFVTTLNNTGQQWDYPNGWAPLQWITVNGMFNYEYNKEGLDAMKKWLNRNQQVYKSTGKMMEKYNVVDTELLAGGGEYPLQDGFGWSNGVALSFQSILERQKIVMPELAQ
ncbi:alpha,alpha-trehalase TreF [Fulvivirga sp.]|uniref:alpha,alpha-trehalase TreF n=1 Tax=Fulvivirga sp. TaxID=1931237 RepID=UPI0032EDBC20